MALGGCEASQGVPVRRALTAAIGVLRRSRAGFQAGCGDRGRQRAEVVRDGAHAGPVALVVAGDPPVLLETSGSCWIPVGHRRNIAVATHPLANRLQDPVAI